MNAKHQQFINEYIRCHGNGTDAYRRVYPNSSYESARREASRLLTNVDISTEIQKRLDENAMSANEVLARLAEHARGDIAEFVNDDGDEIKVSLVDKEGNLKANTRLIKKITQHRTRRTIKDMTTEEVSLAFEMYDAQAALVQLGRHHKLFTDKSEIDNHVTTSNVQVYLPDNGRN